jgi:hypothetical protein
MLAFAWWAFSAHDIMVFMTSQIFFMMLTQRVSGM